MTDPTGTLSVTFTSQTMNYDGAPAPNGQAPAPAAPVVPYVQRGDTALWTAIFTDSLGRPLTPQSVALTICVYGETVAEIPMIRADEQWSAAWLTSQGTLGAPPVEWTISSTGPSLTESGSFQLYP